MILNDFSYTRDWFFSFRWVPPRLFHNVIKSGHSTRAAVATFEAQWTLNPQTNPLEMKLTPTTYRKRYKDIMREVLGIYER